MLRGEPVNSIIKELEQHDDFHNRDDCYLGHSESTYILEYIKKLEAIVDLDAKIRKENHELIHKLNDANNIIDELENWLNIEIDRIEKMINPKKGINPYGKELEYLRIIKNSYIYAKNKLKELKGSDEKC